MSADFAWGMAIGTLLTYAAWWLRALIIRLWRRWHPLRPQRGWRQTTFSGNPIPGSHEWDEKYYGFDRSPWSRYLPVQRQPASGPE